ncbi:MAG: lipocalin family protein [Clostridiales bacterium]|nr:lipocalin family protein [Clostridiales bacterium]
MKKRLWSILTVVVMTVACVFGMLACTDNDDNNKNGNFKEGIYLYWEDPTTTVYSVEFKNGILYMGGSKRGTYTVKGDKVTIKSDDPDDEEPEKDLIIISEGCLKIPLRGNHCAYYVIEGQNPPQDLDMWKN